MSKPRHEVKYNVIVKKIASLLVNYDARTAISVDFIEKKDTKIISYQLSPYYGEL